MSLRSDHCSPRAGAVLTKKWVCLTDNNPAHKRGIGQSTVFGDLDGQHMPSLSSEGHCCCRSSDGPLTWTNEFSQSGREGQGAGEGDSKKGVAIKRMTFSGRVGIGAIYVDKCDVSINHKRS